MDIGEGLRAIQDRMAAAARRAGRDPAGVRLVAVSKRFPPEVLSQAADLGQRIFGENYVQELAEKAQALEARALEWHFIGHLQRNKVRSIIGQVALIHGVDSARLLDEIDKRSEALGIVTPVLIQVNIDEEPQKSGANPGDVEALVRHAATLKGVSLKGLMAIPAAQPSPEATRPSYRALSRLADDLEALGLPGVSMVERSMGMSSDFEVAIEEGATLVRVGSAIFGRRG